VDHGNATDGETRDRSQRCNQHDIWAEMKNIGEYRANREGQPQHIQPERRVDAGAQVLPEPKLEQERSQSDGCDHDKSERT
jgi:hypothetical protein